MHALFINPATLPRPHPLLKPRARRLVWAFDPHNPLFKAQIDYRSSIHQTKKVCLDSSLAEAEAEEVGLLFAFVIPLCILAIM